MNYNECYGIGKNKNEDFLHVNMFDMDHVDLNQKITEKKVNKQEKEKCINDDKNSMFFLY